MNVHESGTDATYPCYFILGLVAVIRSVTSGRVAIFCSLGQSCDVTSISLLSL